MMNFNEKFTEEAISPEELAQKVSMFLTKPENTDTPAPLLLFLKNRGLEAKVFRVKISKEMLSGLYPYPEYEKVIDDHMLDKEAEVFLVTRDSENDSTDSVLNQLAEIIGRDRVPANNANGTLRKEFPGQTIDFVSPSGQNLSYSQNGFHRPVSPQELISHLKVLGLYEEAKKLANQEN